MSISNCSNEGQVNGTNSIGGFIGNIKPSVYSAPVSLLVTNNGNKGQVSAVDGNACGMFCVEPVDRQNINFTTFNSINKGNVDAATNAYGITNIITSARNVVSMGDVTGKSESFTFWNESTDVELFYGMKDKCVSCTNDATLFEYNASTGFFDDVSNHEHVHTLLNDKAVEQGYGMMWTKELDLVDHYVEPSSTSSLCSSSSSSSSSSLQLSSSLPSSSSQSSLTPSSSLQPQSQSSSLPSNQSVSSGNQHTASWLSITIGFILTASFVLNQ